MSDTPDLIRVEGDWYVLATSARADDRTRVLKHADTFAIFDHYGDIQPIGLGEQGVFHEGTRFLSRLELRVNGRRPLLLNSSVKDDNSLLRADLTTPDLYEDGRLLVAKTTVHLFRAKILWEAVQYEHLRVVNYGTYPVAIDLDLLLESDYADIFEVRGSRRAQKGEHLPAEPIADGLLLGYRGLDGILRRTRINVTPGATVVDSRIGYRVELAPHQQREIFVTIGCVVGDTEPPVHTYESVLRRSATTAAERRADRGEVTTSNEQFNVWLSRSAADMAMLTTHTRHGPYPYAGVPWFSTPFGRDGLIAALEYLWLSPQLAAGVLRFLAAHQAATSDDAQDAEPGKILHETRRGEMAALGEVPFGCYYGTVDATPLFVILAEAYYRRTGDQRLIEAIWPNIERALRWIDEFADPDGDGFVEYARHSRNGLVQQGWKDSDDSVFHADGTLAAAPIALCEVQGYVYGAKLAAARLLALLGDTDQAIKRENEAKDLRERFDAAFWCADIGGYALALDGRKRPCRVRTSNAGQALWSGIAKPERAAVLAETLLAADSFSGWGIRTLAKGDPRFNPMAYHNGSIWPHDNALIAKGLADYGHKTAALRVLSGLFDASVHFDLARLPELFCGFDRLPGQGPTLYPVACSPQAWASGAVFYLLQAVLGLEFSPEAPQVTFHHPQLPEEIAHLTIRNLQVVGGVLDIEVRRHLRDVGVNVTRKEGAVEVAVVL